MLKLNLVIAGILFALNSPAENLPIVGRWETNCVPLSPQSSMKFKGDFLPHGLESNFVTLHSTPDCTSAAQDQPTLIQTYTILSQSPTGFVAATQAVDPATVPEGQPYFFKAAFKFVSPNKMKVKYLCAVMKTNGVPAFAPEAQLQMMSSLEWTRVSN